MDKSKLKQTEIGEIPDGWGQMLFEEMAQLIKDGYRPDSNDNLAYIGLEHINQQTLSLNSVGHSSQIESNKFRFESGDILFGKLRPYFRKVYRPRFKGICSTDIWVIRAKEDIEQGYLYYLMANQEFIDLAVSGSSGTRMPRANWTYLENTEWLVPSLDNQRAIVKILSDLDAKIELNYQMNKTLESIAQALFKRWFVDRADSKWGGGKLGDICEKITKGTTPTTLKKGFVEKGINFIKVESIDDCGIFLSDKFAHIDSDTNLLLSRSIIQENDILYTIAGTVGRSVVVTPEVLPANTNQAVAIIRLKNKSLYLSYVRLLLKTSSISEKFQSQVIHAVQPNLSLGVISDTEIVIPDEKALNKFNKQVNSVFQEIRQNTIQTSILSEIRDSLLPRLMSGKIRVN